MKGILEGIRVLDLGRIISAPYCAMLMADMGAEVIKVEKAGKGDEMRSMALFDYTAVNRNKKSITIQFRSEEGKELFRELIKKADVIIENFRPGTMNTMGFGYDDVKKINPKVIMASISGFGQTGPDYNRAAFDPVIQAESGLMSVMGTKQTGPIEMGSPLVDHITSLFTLSGILAALWNREKTGEGQYIDISMLDCAIPMMFTHIPNYSALGKIAGPRDATGPIAAPSKVYKAKDGYLFVIAATDEQFKRFRQIVNIPELMKEEYLEFKYRAKHYQEINDIVSNWISNETVDHVSALLEKAGLPVGNVYTIDKAINSKQAVARKSVVDIDVLNYGKVKFGGNPIKISGYQISEYKAAPELGADNETIYKDLLGLSEAKIKELKEKKII